MFMLENDFKRIIDQNDYYVDKSLLINDVLDQKVTFYLRPNGFGKTLNMSMLYYFFAINEKENAYLFDNLKISNDKQALLHQNKYPVIFLSFKSLKGYSFKDILKKYQLLLQNWLHQNIKKPEANCNIYDLYCGNNDNIQLNRSLFDIINYLKDLYHQNVIIIIDDYDAPLYYGYINRFNQDINDFIIELIHSITNNQVVFKAIFTGQTNLKKEHQFLKKLSLNTIFSTPSFQSFGFTEIEVRNLLIMNHQIDDLPAIKNNFGGYNFNNEYLYHPKWVIQYLKQINNQELFDYDQIVLDILLKNNHLIESELNRLLSNQTIIKKINKQLCYDDLANHNNIFSYLLYKGLLTFDKSVNPYLSMQHLKIPNLTVKQLFLENLYTWYDKYIITNRNKFIDAIFTHQNDKAGKIINDIINAPIAPKHYNASYYQNVLSLLLGPLMQVVEEKTTYLIYYRFTNHESRLASISLNIFDARDQFYQAIKADNKHHNNDKYNYELLLYQNNCYIHEK